MPIPERNSGGRFQENERDFDVGIDRILEHDCDDDEKLGMILSNQVTHCLGDKDGMAIAEIAFDKLISDLKKWKNYVHKEA